MPQAEGAARLPVSAGLVGLWAVGALITLMSIGRGGSVVDAVVLLPQIVLWAAPGFAYLASAIGYGLLLRPLVRGARDEAVLVAGVGLAAIALVSHGAGVAGLLNGRAAAVALLVPGWAGLGRFLWMRRGVRVRIPGASPIAVVAAIPLVTLVAAAAAPPSWLWDSEYGGFDALSYHLQLPQEWLRLGRLWPLEHNVYSYLPGSFEAAVLHLAAFTGAEVSPGAGRATGGFGLLAGTGWRAVAAQLLHAWMTLMACWMIGRAGWAAAMACGASAAGARRASIIAGCLALATPWCVVVGSLAYNEMPVLGLGAAALCAALDRDLAPWRRGLLAGLLVGAACGFKPTAMTFFTPGVGLALLVMSPARQWPVLITAAGLAGAAMLAPWLARNALACGNPVFPFASGLFGSGHWTAEQVARYAAGHSFDGSLADRLQLLLAPDPAAQATRGGVVRDVERWRGLFNPQYAALFPAAAGALVGGLIRRRGCGRVLLLLGGVLALQVAAWLFTTHLQARFLLPLVVPACMLIGLTLGRGGARAAGSEVASGGSTDKFQRPPLASRIPGAIAVVLVGVQTWAVVTVFARQQNDGPNEATTAGPALFTGEYLPEPREFAPAMLARGLPPGSVVYLLGDATPFYLDAGLRAGNPARVVWHTTWDASPLGEAIRASGDDPAAWTRELRARGITHVLANRAELVRYQRNGWYDPQVTADRVAAWLASIGPPMVAWDRTKQELYELPRTPQPASAPPPATDDRGAP